MKVGEEIRRMRLEKGIKQIQLARMTGISNTYLSDIERGRTNPSLKTFSRIVEVLGIKIGWNITDCL